MVVIKINKIRLLYFFFPILVVIIIILGIIKFPNQSIIAAKKGISIWVNVLIPSLLPFIIGAVATGMLKNPSLGYLMLLCHYLGSISVGILFRNYGKESLDKNNSSLKSNILNTIDNRYEDKRGFFVLFGNAVFNGINTLLSIGGFVIVFSVVFEIFSLFNIISLISSILCIPLSIFGVTKELCNAFISGLFEMTIGCDKISSVLSASEVLRASLSSFLIGFSGLSILAQCCSFIAKTDINTKSYILSKFLHGTLAGMFTFLLYPLLKSDLFVSNFDRVHNFIYDTSLWSFYLRNYNIILPMVIIVYIFIILSILEKTSYKLNKES